MVSGKDSKLHNRQYKKTYMYQSLMEWPLFSRWQGEVRRWCQKSFTPSPANRKLTPKLKVTGITGVNANYSYYYKQTYDNTVYTRIVQVMVKSL